MAAYYVYRGYMPAGYTYPTYHYEQPQQHVADYNYSSAYSYYSPPDQYANYHYQPGYAPAPPAQPSGPLPLSMQYSHMQSMVNSSLQVQQWQVMEKMGLVERDEVDEAKIRKRRRKGRMYDYEEEEEEEEEETDPDDVRTRLEERAARAEEKAKLLQEKLQANEGLKEELRSKFIDELMRRQDFCGTFELTSGTVFNFEDYDSDDPVAIWFGSERSTRLNIEGKRWDALFDAEFLRDGVKGFGTDEDKIIAVCATRSNQQRNRIFLEYKTAYGRSLVDDLASDLSGNFQVLVLGLFETPARYDAYCAKKAIYGLGTDEHTLIEILMTRTNAQIREMVSQYNLITYSKQKDPQSSLEVDIRDDCGGDFKRLLISASTGNRRLIDREMLEEAVEEVLHNGVWTGMFQINYDKLCDAEICGSQAQELYKAGEDRWGTDEETFNRIFSTGDMYTLRRVYDEYVKLSQRDIMNSVHRETSGDYKVGLLAIAQSVKCKPMFFAEKLYHSMKGLGTKDGQLIRIVISRSEIDMQEIKRCFLEKYKQTVWNFIKDDCSGDYKKLLQALVGRN